MIADEFKRGLGYIFVVEQLVVPLLALVGATSTEAAMKHWLVTYNKPNMVGPFFVQCPDFLQANYSGRSSSRHLTASLAGSQGSTTARIYLGYSLWAIISHIGRRSSHWS